MYDSDQHEVMSVAVQLCGSKAKAHDWYQYESISTFDELTPRQLVTAGRGAALLRYLRSLQAGATG